MDNQKNNKEKSMDVPIRGGRKRYAVQSCDKFSSYIYSFFKRPDCGSISCDYSHYGVLN